MNFIICILELNMNGKQFWNWNYFLSLFWLMLRPRVCLIGVIWEKMKNIYIYIYMGENNFVLFEKIWDSIPVYTKNWLVSWSNDKELSFFFFFSSLSETYLSKDQHCSFLGWRNNTSVQILGSTIHSRFFSSFYDFLF